MLKKVCKHLMPIYTYACALYMYFYMTYMYLFLWILHHHTTLYNLEGVEGLVVMAVVKIDLNQSVLSQIN